MSAKLLHSLSGENPDLQKQVGCINGIFQLFDRHHFLSGHRRFPPASGAGQGNNHGTTPNTILQQRPTEKNKKNALKERDRISNESSRKLFSSSSCSSSFSSIDNKQSHPELETEPSPYVQNNFPICELPIYQPNNSLQLCRKPVDIRDVVKGSVYREAREISIKTATKETAGGGNLKYMVSQRPLQQPKSVETRELGLNELLGQNESFRGSCKTSRSTLKFQRKERWICSKGCYPVLL